jgi:hypothetical protein
MKELINNGWRVLRRGNMLAMFHPDRKVGAVIRSSISPFNPPMPWIDAFNEKEFQAFKKAFFEYDFTKMRKIINSIHR